MTLPTTAHLSDLAETALGRMGVAVTAGGNLEVATPITGGVLAAVDQHSSTNALAAVNNAAETFHVWREVPAPRRGEFVRRIGELLRRHKDDLGLLVSVEVGKIRSEGLGEVQEMIDICDLAVGLSRQLPGRTMPSERPGHRLAETWHPLGPVGVITAFNFPVAVWAWNAALAFVCGDPVVWKPSDKAPLCALAVQAIVEQAAADTGAPAALSQVIIGGRDVGEALVDDVRIPLVSATGSVATGRTVGQRVAARLGRCLLELGGNNAAIIRPSADLDLVVRAVTFAAAGTAGQRCTTLRRLIVHPAVHDEVVERVTKAYDSLPIGDPLADGTLVGPLIDLDALVRVERALERVGGDGGEVVVGGERVLADEAPEAAYLRPALAVMPAQTELVKEETFGPLLYVLTAEDLDEAIALHNDVPQGLASSIFTNDLREAERFTSAAGSDCGIANVNIGPSGAEIGGAFGGEKETGGGREAGSDSWRAYCRRQTTTVNATSDLPLAQGVKFT